MLEIKKKSGTLTMVLPQDATMAAMENDAEKMKKTVETLKGVRIARIDCSKVLEIDSSYLQLLISFCKTMRSKEIPVKAGGDMEKVHHLMALYGLSAEDLCLAGE